MAKYLIHYDKMTIEEECEELEAKNLVEAKQKFLKNFYEFYNDQRIHGLPIRCKITNIEHL